MEFNGIGSYGPDGQTIITYNKNTAIIYNSKTGKLLNTLSNKLNNIKDLCFSPDGSKIMAYTINNDIIIWNANSGELIVTYPLKGDLSDFHWETKRVLSTEYSRFILSDIDSINWIVTTPSRFFDATPGALNKIYFVKGLEIIPLESYFEQFYRPHLWERIMNGEKIEQANVGFYNQKPAPKIKITFPPSDSISFRGENKINLSTNKSDFLLKYSLTDRGGGINEIRIFQNGKLIFNSFETINEKDKSIYRSCPLKLLSGINTIKVTVFNDDRIEKSETTGIEYTGIDKEPVNLYVLAIGINEYQKNSYNLNYAVSDEISFKEAITIGAKDIFDEVNITSIQNDEATKENILNLSRKFNQSASREMFLCFIMQGMAPCQFL